VVLGVMPSVMRTYGDDGGALGLRPSGPRSQGLRGLRGFVRPNFRVANMAKSVRYRRNVRNVLNRAKT